MDDNRRRHKYQNISHTLEALCDRLASQASFASLSGRAILGSLRSYLDFLTQEQKYTGGAQLPPIIDEIEAFLDDFSSDHVNSDKNSEWQVRLAKLRDQYNKILPDVLAGIK